RSTRSFLLSPRDLPSRSSASLAAIAPLLGRPLAAQATRGTSLPSMVERADEDRGTEANLSTTSDSQDRPRREDRGASLCFAHIAVSHRPITLPSASSKSATPPPFGMGVRA